MSTMYINYSFRASKCMHEVKKAHTFENKNNRPYYYDALLSTQNEAARSQRSALIRIQNNCPYDYDALLLETNLHEAKQARTFESENKSLRL